MAEKKKQGSQGQSGKGGPYRKTVARNRKARHDYHIEDTFEAGIILLGSEVKSLRAGKAHLTNSYAKLDDRGEVWLVGCHISEYPWSHQFNHTPERPRKLLLHTREIYKLSHRVNDKGFTLIPLEIYFNEVGKAKVLLGVAKGKRAYDRRETIKERETGREIAATMKARSRQNR